MKIGFVFDDSLDRTDGVQQYLLTLGVWLQSQGHEVHYLVGETNRTDLKNVHSLSKNLQVKFNKNRLTIPKSANKKQIKDLLAKERFDVIHVQMPYSPLLSGRIIDALPSKTRLVGTFHIVPYSKLQKLGSRLLGKIEQRRLKRFDAMVSVSEAAQHFAKKYFKAETEVLPNVIDLTRFKVVPKKRILNSQITIVFLGRLVERKGADRLIRAVSHIPAPTTDNVLVKIGGKGPLEPKLRQLTKDLKVEHKVQFEGFVAEESKADFLASGDIAVFPSSGGESFGIILLEAMATGASAVLAHPNEGYSEVMSGSESALIQTSDVEEFARVLAELITDANKRNAMIKEQSKIVRKYDVNIIGPRLLSIYKDKKLANN